MPHQDTYDPAQHLFNLSGLTKELMRYNNNKKKQSEYISNV